MSRAAVAPPQDNEKCDEAVGYVCTPDTNVCWKNVTDASVEPYGWSADLGAMTTNGSVTTVQFV
jgi:hypothetical protein